MPPAPHGYSDVVKLLHCIRRLDLISKFQSEEVSDELLPYVDCDSFASLGLTALEAAAAVAFRTSGYSALPSDAAAMAAHADATDITSMTPLSPAPHTHAVHNPTDIPFPAQTFLTDPGSASSLAPAIATTVAEPSQLPPPDMNHVAVTLQSAYRCSAAHRQLMSRAGMYDRALAATASVTAHTQKCLSALARLGRLQRKCEEHNVGIQQLLDMNLKSSSGFLADVSFPVLFGRVAAMTLAWKAVEADALTASVSRSPTALSKWWRRLHDPTATATSLATKILHALHLSAAHTSSFIMRGGALWAWLLKARPAVQAFMALPHHALAASDVEEDIFALLAAPMHALAGVCDALASLCDLGQISSHFVVVTSTILQSIQSQFQVLLSEPPPFTALSLLKISWVQVCKISFVSAIPPPPGALSSPPLPAAASTASFVPDCIAVLTVLDPDIRIVFPCWPWVLQLPSTDATLDADSSSSCALLNMSGLCSLHLMFYSKVLEKSWYELLNRDRVLRAAASSPEDGDCKVSCSIADTEQRVDWIRECVKPFPRCVFVTLMSDTPSTSYAWRAGACSGLSAGASAISNNLCSSCRKNCRCGRSSSCSSCRQQTASART
jgi:hypothetical protein